MERHLPMPRLPGPLAAALLSMTVATGGWAQSDDVVWRSNAATPDQLSAELETLYLSLYNSGNLAVRQGRLGDPPFVEDLLRSERVWFGAYFPISMDALACDLNPDVCSRSRVPATSQEMQSDTGHVGGIAASAGQWRAAAGQALWIPDYRFDSLTTLSRVEVSPDWTPESLTADPMLDCSRWGLDCAEIVRQYNPPLAKAPDGWGGAIVTVPVSQLETRLPGNPAPGDPAPAGAEQPILSDRAPRTYARPVPADADAGPAFRARPSDPSMLESLGRNLMPQGRINRYSVSAELFYPHQKPLFDLIHHPYGRGEDLPDDTRDPVTVLVVDREPAAAHCNWNAAWIWDRSEMRELPPFARPEEARVPGGAPAGSASTAPAVTFAGTDGADGTASDGAARPPGHPPCAAAEPSPEPDFDDHAVGIGGLIAAQPNRNGILGLNPYAKLVYLGLEDDQAGTLIDTLDLVPPETRVANVSLGVSLGNSAFGQMQDKLAAYSETVLFVVAAGNEGEELGTGVCNIMPACEVDLDNVVTVVGFDNNDRRPGLWQTALAATNHSPRFDIAAIASPVLTTTARNRYGWQQGTSFATPQVAATASLVFAAAEKAYVEEAGSRVAPKIVRDRLVYTADYFSNQVNNVFAGRLNVERALQVTKEQVVLQDGRRLVGRVQAAPPRYTCFSESDPGNEGHSWFWLRRILYDPGSGRWMVYRHRGGSDAGQIKEGARYTPLDRTDWCTLGTTSDPTIRILLDNTSTVATFQLSEIADYTSRLFN